MVRNHRHDQGPFGKERFPLTDDDRAIDHATWPPGLTTLRGQAIITRKGKILA